MDESDSGSAEVVQCGAQFDCLLHVATICARPKGHVGPHHPTAMHGDSAEKAIP